MYNNDFAKYLDELRESRNMSKEEFIDGIISLRQYYRFQNGEYSLKNETINEMFDRLQISQTTAYQFYFSDYNQTSKKLNKVYPLIFSRKLKEANSLLNEIDYKSLKYNDQRRFYNILKLIIDNHLNKIPYNTATEKIIELIDYPQILDKEFLSFSEVSGLLFIIKKLIADNDLRVCSMAYDLIIKNNTDKPNFLKYSYRLPFYVITAQMLGYTDQFKESITIASKSIEDVFSNSDYVQLIYLYLIIAMGHKNLNDNKYRDYVRKVFMLLHVEGNSERTKEFSETIMKLFLLKESDLIEYK